MFPRCSFLRFRCIFLASLVVGHRAINHVDAALALSGPSTVQAPSMSNFVLNGVTGQPPQVRYHEFVVQELMGAPDGVVKPMIVVNGKSLPEIVTLTV